MIIRNKATWILLGSVFCVTYFLNFLVFKVDTTIAHLSTYAFILLIFILLKGKNLLGLSFALSLSFILTLQVVYVFLFGEKVSFSVLDSIIETNKVELFELSGHLFLKLILPSIIITFSLFMLVRQQREFSNYLKIMPIILILMSVVLTVKKVNARLISDVKEDVKEGGRFLRDKYPVVIGDLLYLYTSSVTNNKYGDLREIQVFDESIVGKNKDKSSLVVFIIGESSMSKRYSSYGYSIDTTPRMNKIFSSEGGCIIENAHSSAPITRNSISMSLSFYNPESEEKLFSRKSIIEMAASNGYETYWLGAQTLTGLHSSKYGFIANKSKEILNSNNKDYELSKDLEKILKSSVKDKFIIVHLNGSHIPYNNFDEIDVKALPGADEYDLTIHHTDRVINEIYQVIDNNILENSKYSLIYTSDHGEVVGKGHGYPTGKDQYLIPFMYKSNNNQYDCSFIRSFVTKDGWLSGLMNRYILSNLIGYSLDSSIVQKEKNNDRILSAEDLVIPYSDIK